MATREKGPLPTHGAVERTRWPDPLRLVVLAAAVPVLLWPAQLVPVAVTEGVRWSVELWSGVVGLSVLVAAVLGVVLGWTSVSAFRGGRGAHRPRSNYGVTT